MNRSTRRALGALALGATLSLSLVACGKDTDLAGQPHLGGERFTKIDFDGLPRPSNGKRLEYSGVGLNQTEKVEILETNAATALKWYQEKLEQDGWTKKTGPTETRDGTLVTYERMGRTVAVLSAEEKPTKPEDPAGAVVTVSYNRYDKPGG